MECREAREILASRPRRPGRALRRHVEACTECRRFREDVLRIEAACRVPVETPVDLRERTLERCGDLLAEQAAVAGRSRGPVPGRAQGRSRRPWWRRALDSPRLVTAAAVLGTAVLAVVTAVEIDGAADAADGLALKLALFQIVAQNVLTALLVPALLVLRQRTATGPPHATQTGE